MATKFQALIETSATSTHYVNNVSDAYSLQYTQQQTYYVLNLIKRLLPYLPMWEDAQKVTIPGRSDGFSTNSIQFRKFNSLHTGGNSAGPNASYSAVSTTALTEGVAPDGLNMTTAKVTTQLAQYGDWIKLTDLAVSASLDDVMKEAMDLLAEDAGLKLHRVIINALTGADLTQQILPGALTNANQITASDVLTSTMIKKAVRTLRNNNVMPYPDGFYRAVIHPYQAYDLMNDSLWQDVAKYNGGNTPGGGLDLIKGEIGKMHGVRFRESTEIATDLVGASGTVPTYHSLVYGPNAWGVFDFKSQAVNSIDDMTGKGISIHHVPVNTPTKDDPLGQFGLIGWKASFAAKIIDPLRIIRLRSGATA